MGSDIYNGATSNVSGNNVSTDLRGVLGVKKQQDNPFLIGSSKLNEGSTFAYTTKNYIGSVVSDENGIFPTPYELTLSTNRTTTLTIAFDTINKRHPHKISVDGVDYYDDDAIFTVFGLTENSTHTIVIDNWNTPNAPLLISGIYVNINIDIDYSNLIDIESSIFDRSDIKLPSYGIISNGGNIEFRDTNGEIRDYAEQQILSQGLKVEIMLNDTLAQTEEQVAIFNTDTWDYDNDNRTVSVSLKDDLEEWQDIAIQGFGYDVDNPRKDLPNQTMADLYRWLHAKTPSKYNMLPFESLNAETQQVLSATRIEYPFLEDGSLWEQWTKLCEVCALSIYKNNVSNTVCVYVGK